MDESSICKIYSLEDLCAFTARYSVKGDPENNKIDWGKVANEWAGVEMSQNALNEEAEDKVSASRSKGKPTSQPMAWLCGWDIGSGCIWDASVITGSKKLRKVDPILTNLASYASEFAER